MVESLVYLTPLALVLSMSAYAQAASLNKDVEQRKKRRDHLSRRT